MSCFVVSDKHIHTILAFVVKYTDNKYIYGKDTQHLLESNAHISKIGQILLDQNYRSYNHRYNETGGAPKYKYSPLKADIVNPIGAIKLCQSLDYQSCETNDWKETEAYSIVQSIIGLAIYKLDGYDAAKWSI